MPKSFQSTSPGASCVSFLLLSCALSAAARADIAYTIRPNADLSRVDVEMTAPVKCAGMDVQLPSWSPGYYVLQNYWQNLTDLVAADQSGKPLTVTHPRGDTWHIDTGASRTVKLRYSRPLQQGDFSMGIFNGDSEVALVEGPKTYLYVVGLKEEPCRLTVDAPANWKVAVGLQAKGPFGFFADNYDVLADNPVTIGNLRLATYTVRGIEHTLAIRGKARDKLDLDKAVAMTRNITIMESDFFGGLPYKKYVWQISARDVPDGAGGVEHATSSQDFLALGMGPGAMRGLAHEYFHLWNVKRIRSRALGPFDYTQLPRTGALWWLEGVTDYYASLIPHRYGWHRDGEYLRDIARNIRALRGNPARLEVSPYDSSLRVADAADGRGNSNGYKVSYYNTGWVLGMLFDIELRSRTAGKVSLDDVEMQLWRKCRKSKVGFEEGEIRRLLVKYGGKDLGDLYDTWVMRPGELPIEAQLAKVGLILQGSGRELAVVDALSVTESQRELRKGWYLGRHTVEGRDADSETGLTEFTELGMQGETHAKMRRDP